MEKRYKNLIESLEVFYDKYGGTVKHLIKTLYICANNTETHIAIERKSFLVEALHDEEAQFMIRAMKVYDPELHCALLVTYSPQEIRLHYEDKEAVSKKLQELLDKTGIKVISTNWRFTGNLKYIPKPNTSKL